MTFERSAFGQANRRLFFGVDAVVYVEGGDEEAAIPETYEIPFWRTIFLEFRPDIKCRFLPKGSKSVLVDIARQVIVDDIPGVYIALDADYDRIMETLLDDKRVIYTFGYSWENEVFSPENLIRTFYAVCPICDEGVNVAHEVSELYDDFCQKVKRLCHADYLGVLSGFGVIPRDRPGRMYEEPRRRQAPQLSTVRMHAAVRTANRARLGKLPRTRERALLEMPRDCVGHLLKVFAHRLIGYLMDNYSGRRGVSWDQFIAAAIQAFAITLREDQDAIRAEHYRMQLAA